MKYECQMAKYMKADMICVCFFQQSSRKKKVISKFGFPRTIDMRPWFSSLRALGGDANRMLCDLFTILVHKASMVNGGHYVAHISDDQIG